MSENQIALKPFLKWAGGKRWLPSRYPHLFPCEYERYIEPFVGGAAVFFALQPAKACLGDSNAHLMDCYRAIQSNWRYVWRYLKAYERAHSNSFYYEVRGSSAHRSIFREAARFIYLNRTCFNGIYRENLEGKFNVPRGTKDAVTFPDDDFSLTSKLLQSACLSTQDFANTIDDANADDFLFVDPPYTVRHNMNGFVKYNQRIFSWNDQVRLRALLFAAVKRGVKVLMTNANHASIRELYSGFGCFHVLTRRSVIAANERYRGPSTELAITMGFEPSSSLTVDPIANYSTRSAGEALRKP